MTFLDLITLAEQDLDLLNPSTPEKVQALGARLALPPGARVLDLGRGYGQLLRNWAHAFGIRGVGVDIRPQACARAQALVTVEGLAEQVTIVCQNAAEYLVEQQAYEVAVCLGSTFIWGGYLPTLHALRPAIAPHGYVVVGERYWRTQQVPTRYQQQAPDILSEPALLAATRQAGFELVGVVRSSEADWDAYVSGNWQGWQKWLAHHPAHSAQAEVKQALQHSQDEYFAYEREYVGWAMFVLTPQRPTGSAT